MINRNKSPKIIQSIKMEKNKSNKMEMKRKIPLNLMKVQVNSNKILK